MRFQIGQIVSVHSGRLYVVMDKQIDEDGVIIYSLIDTHSAEMAEMRAYGTGLPQWWAGIWEGRRTAIEEYDGDYHYDIKEVAA